ncbi:hypothetical protein IXO675_015710 [Xanthomonas oryzae pv. oryzae]|uniref:Uncharacterized protein n=1 Tax=Xanthomonas oryzae pv. oryzae TaxID=64187 RepID=A0AAJ5MDQ0_XANOO|nr:hypothetical protein GKO49_06250 [Xanthomonas oryzae pv. oryzae]QUW74155.1 hypothetical protein KCI36_12595 [Xanthomonas oryzae]QIF24400.1 hypothetical protein G6N84_23115 [Xanthomonas oryzae pv. oryzae]QQD48954.1 hypothetical protein BXO512_017840 [Xanthomonas oryzae pv. oryzae]UAD92357.1 hypothetical protein H9N23_02945 [Xanthomonas oryzae pv. oryzae]
MTSTTTTSRGCATSIGSTTIGVLLHAWELPCRIAITATIGCSMRLGALDQSP